jgi:hypothetical protein
MIHQEGYYQDVSVPPFRIDPTSAERGRTMGKGGVIAAVAVVGVAVVGGGIYLASNNAHNVGPVQGTQPKSVIASPSAGEPTRALNVLLVIKDLRSTLSAPVTTYSVTAEDANGGQLSYSWTMTPTSPDGRCGTPLVTWTQAVNPARWSHSHDAPDNCPHLGTNHPVKAEVTIKVLTGRDEGVTAVCDLFGSETQTIAPPDSTCHFSL